MVAIMVKAKATFGLEEVNEASSAYLSTTFERYIAFSSLRYESRCTFACSEQLSQHKAAQIWRKPLNMYVVRKVLVWTSGTQGHIYMQFILRT